MLARVNAYDRYFGKEQGVSMASSSRHQGDTTQVVFIVGV